MIQIPQRSDPSPRPFRSARPKTSTHSSWPELWADRTAWPIDYAHGDFDNDHFSGSVETGNAVVSTI